MLSISPSPALTPDDHRSGPGETLAEAVERLDRANRDLLGSPSPSRGHLKAAMEAALAVRQLCALSSDPQVASETLARTRRIEAGMLRYMGRKAGGYNLDSWHAQQQDYCATRAREAEARGDHDAARRWRDAAVDHAVYAELAPCVAETGHRHLDREAFVHAVRRIPV